jgi:hypothetical protein
MATNPTTPETTNFASLEGSDDRVTERFARPLAEFVSTVESLRELIDSLSPHVEDLDVLDSVKALEQLADVSKLPADQRREFRAEVGKAFERALRGERPPRRRRSASARADEDSPRRITAKKREQLEAFIKAFERDSRKRTGPRLAKRQLLNRSLLTSLVASLEVLIGNVVAAFYYANPSALGASEKEFSLADLRRMGSIDDAVDEAIASRSDAFLRQSTDDWRRWFARTIKTDFAEMAGDWAAVNEVIERRHLIVHNGSLVSKQYLSKVPLSQPPEIGTELRVDDEYFRTALDHVLVFGALLATITWHHVHAASAQRPAEEIQHLTETLMEGGRWDAVLTLALVGRDRLATTDVQRHTFQFNWWLARLETGDDPHSEVESFDDSALMPVFRFVRLALLDEKELATRLVDHLVESKAIRLRDLREWPILRRLRDYEPFAESLKRLEAAERRRQQRRRRELTATTEGNAGAPGQSEPMEERSVPRVSRRRTTSERT